MPDAPPTAQPSAQTAEYLARCTDPDVLSLDALRASLRAFTRQANAGVQQLGIWQRELRDAKFDETDGHLCARIGNCDQRQKAMLETLNQLTSLLERLRDNIDNLQTDQAELIRCATVVEPIAPEEPVVPTG